jgi:RNA polymerase-binding transcription factor DksA
MNPSTARGLLRAERQRLEELLLALSTNGQERGELQVVVPEPSSNDQHPADLATDTFERARDMSIAQRVEAEITDVDRALQRIDQGTYGTCEACSRKIDHARLQVLPATRFCVEDQQRAEREAP